MQEEKPKVLLVDDEADIREPYKFMLETLGFDVQTARSGYGALKLMEWKMPDVIVLDYEMPVMNGLELLKIIKKKHPFLPAFMLTAHDDTDVGFEAGKAGVEQFIVKPPDIVMLATMIEQAVKRSRPANNENCFPGGTKV